MERKLGIYILKSFLTCNVEIFTNDTNQSLLTAFEDIMIDLVSINILQNSEYKCIPCVINYKLFYACKISTFKSV